MRIEVKFSGTSLAAYAARVDALGQQGQVEMARGLNAGGEKVRTQVRRALKTQMNVVSQSVIEEHTSSLPASAGSLEYRILGTGKGLPIKLFPWSAAVHSPVTAEPWGTTYTFDRSFMTKRGLLRARRGEARKPIRSLRGGAPAKEIVKDQSLATFKASVTAIVEPTIMARLVRLLP